MTNSIPGPGYGPLEGEVTGPAGRPTKDRALELAEWLMNNPWVDHPTRKVCQTLVKAWKKEDAALTGRQEKT